MAKPKPLMTPEQQKMFKKAVAENSIPAMKYEDYCKITPEEAEKMLKAVAIALFSGAGAGSRWRNLTAGIGVDVIYIILRCDIHIAGGVGAAVVQHKMIVNNLA